MKADLQWIKRRIREYDYVEEISPEAILGILDDLVDELIKSQEIET